MIALQQVVIPVVAGSLDETNLSTQAEWNSVRSPGPRSVG